MVSRGVPYEARTDLIMFDRGSVTAQRYVEDIFKTTPFPPIIGENLRFMQTTRIAIPQIPSLSTLMRLGFKFYHGRQAVPV